MKNHIILEFDDSITRLAGYPYGKSIYEKQVKDRINFDNVSYITFPPQIVAVASSFVQGFFEEIVENVGIPGVGELVIVQTGSEQLTKSIIDNLL